MQSAENLCALFPGRAAEGNECALRCGDCALRVLFIGHGYTGDHLTVGWLDDVHHLAAVGFHECSIDVVRRDCLHCTPADIRVKTGGVACDPVRNDASALPVTDAPNRCILNARYRK